MGITDIFRRKEDSIDFEENPILKRCKSSKEYEDSVRKMALKENELGDLGQHVLEELINLLESDDYKISIKNLKVASKAYPKGLEGPGIGMSMDEYKYLMRQLAEVLVWAGSFSRFYNKKLFNKIKELAEDLQEINSKLKVIKRIKKGLDSRDKSCLYNVVSMSKNRVFRRCKSSKKLLKLSQDWIKLRDQKKEKGKKLVKEIIQVLGSDDSELSIKKMKAEHYPSKELSSLALGMSEKDLDEYLIHAHETLLMAAKISKKYHLDDEESQIHKLLVLARR